MESSHSLTRIGQFSMSEIACLQHLDGAAQRQSGIGNTKKPRNANPLSQAVSPLSVLG